MDAVANLATMQTGAMAGGLAYEAHTAAGKAMMAYMDAKAASEAAAAAEDVTAAVEARIMAAAAMADAVKYATMASDKGTAAETAAMAELMIDGKDKNVGGTALNADDRSSVVTTDGDTVTTGRIKTRDPMTTGDGATGRPHTVVQDAADMAYVQAVTATDLTIGRTLDTSDDMARLMLVTHYAGTKMVRVYNEGTETESGTKVGYISIVNDDANANNVALKSEGTYYPAGTAVVAEGGLNNMDDVADGAKPKEVFSYKDPADNNNKKYVVSTTRSIGDESTIYFYVNVDVTAADAAVNEGGDLIPAEVRANIPEAIEYKHIHFGVWAALGAAAKSGSQDLSDLGIGFVQNFSGEGMTSIGGGSDDMPNGGEAAYSGSWVAAVQMRDEDGDGDIALEHGAAMLGANFGKATITATLTGLATLEGAIDGNMFSGTKATVMGGNPRGLDSDGEFTGSFGGGFYGAKAAEAGGIFDFTSEDSEAGAFRGAFGGDKE